MESCYFFYFLLNSSRNDVHWEKCQKLQFSMFSIFLNQITKKLHLTKLLFYFRQSIHGKQNKFNKQVEIYYYYNFFLNNTENCNNFYFLIGKNKWIAQISKKKKKYSTYWISNNLNFYLLFFFKVILEKKSTKYKENIKLLYLFFIFGEIWKNCRIFWYLKEIFLVGM